MTDAPERIWVAPCDLKENAQEPLDEAKEAFHAYRLGR